MFKLKFWKNCRGTAARNRVLQQQIDENANTPEPVLVTVSAADQPAVDTGMDASGGQTVTGSQEPTTTLIVDQVPFEVTTEVQEPIAAHTVTQERITEITGGQNPATTEWSIVHIPQSMRLAIIEMEASNYRENIIGCQTQAEALAEHCKRNAVVLHPATANYQLVGRQRALVVSTPYQREVRQRINAIREMKNEISPNRYNHPNVDPGPNTFFHNMNEAAEGCLGFYQHHKERYQIMFGCRTIGPKVVLASAKRWESSGNSPQKHPIFYTKNEVSPIPEIENGPATPGSPRGPIVDDAIPGPSSKYWPTKTADEVKSKAFTEVEDTRSPREVVFRRLKLDYLRLKKEPLPYIDAEIDDNNFLKWHFILQGPPATHYSGGYYHGTIKFPDDFPFKAPKIYMVTPTGRFQVNKSICLSNSAYHPDLWNPTWSVGSIIQGLLSFMVEETPTIGEVRSTMEEKESRAKKSVETCLKDPDVQKFFPLLCMKLRKIVEARNSERAKKIVAAYAKMARDHRYRK